MPIRMSPNRPRRNRIIRIEHESVVHNRDFRHALNLPKSGPRFFPFCQYMALFLFAELLGCQPCAQVSVAAVLDGLSTGMVLVLVPRNPDVRRVDHHLAADDVQMQIQLSPLRRLQFDHAIQSARASLRTVVCHREFRRQAIACVEVFVQRLDRFRSDGFRSRHPFLFCQRRIRDGPRPTHHQRQHNSHSLRLNQHHITPCVLSRLPNLGSRLSDSIMSILSFRRKPEGRSVSMLESGVWEVRELWQAIFDVEVTDPLAFLGDPALPGLGDTHPNNAYLRLKSVTNGVPAIDQSLRTLNFNLVWVTSTLPPTKQKDDKYVDSLRATKSWSHRVISEPVPRAFVSDNDGATFSAEEEPVASTVKEIFIPGISRNRYLPTCHYVRNELIVPPLVLTLPGIVNNDSFTLDGIALTAGQALIIAAPVSESKRFESYTFRTVAFDIMCKEDGWDEKLLNRGFTEYKRPTAGGTPVPGRAMIPNDVNADDTDRPWVPSPEPMTLDLSGRSFWFDTKELGNLPEEWIPHYRVFRHLTRTSFTALGFT